MPRVWELAPNAGIHLPHCAWSSCFKALLRNHLLQEACHALASSGCPSYIHICLLLQSGSNMEARTVS